MMEMVRRLAIFTWIKRGHRAHLTFSNSPRQHKIGLKLFPLLLMAVCALSKTTKAVAQDVEVGAITDVRGAARVVRNTPYNASLNFGLRLRDDLRTSDGRLEATFLDDSTVRLTEHSSMVIDEYVFDPNPSKSKMAISFASGTARFITGQLGRIDKKNIKLRTPTADIAIRGTDFTCTVDELGRSLIILLPKLDGTSSGEIVVTTAMGSTVLNKPYEATTVDVYEGRPTAPVVLDLTLDVIDNLLIVSPPKTKSNLRAEQASTTEVDDVLDVDFLDVDFLAEDFLEEEPDFTSLDVDYLATEFLEDLLNIIDALAVQEEQDQLAQLATSIDIKGTSLGQDPVTQIVTIIQGQQVSLTRKVSQSTQINIDGSGAYTLIITQGGVTNTVLVNGGGSSLIRITQGS